MRKGCVSFLLICSLFIHVFNIRAETNNDDPAVQAFWKLMFDPSIENLHSARKRLSESSDFRPYAHDIHQMLVLSKTGAAPEKVIEIYLGSMPNLILSPSAHRMAGEAFKALGKEEYADFERKVFLVLLKCLLSSGDGTKDNPYAVMRISDEHDILETLGKKSRKQALIQDPEKGRILDQMTCSDGSQVYFDITLFFGRSE